MEKILISACLVGDKTKYDGSDNLSPSIQKLLEKFELIPFCPEVEGGLSVPREPSEIKGDKVITKSGRDVTFQFEKGAELAYNICLYFGIKYAILKDHSPSCGSSLIHDGNFSGKLINGEGVTTKYLKSKGIMVINEKSIEEFIANY